MLKIYLEQRAIDLDSGRSSFALEWEYCKGLKVASKKAANRLPYSQAEKTLTLGPIRYTLLSKTN